MNDSTMSSSTSNDSSRNEHFFGTASFATPRPNTTDEERSQGTRSTPSPGKSRSSPERVINANRPLQKIWKSTRLFTDHEDFYPFGLSSFLPTEDQELVVQDLLKHSLPINIGMLLSYKGSHKHVEGDGQACLILTQRGIVIATVKHNFCKEINKETELEQCTFAHLMAGSNVFLHEGLVKLLNWDADKLTARDAFRFNSMDHPYATWKYGNELELVPLGESLLSEAIENGDLKAFEAVSTTFTCMVGMQIGIMASSCGKKLAENMENGLKSGPEHYQAQEGDKFITVGSITHVGENHMEYNVNTVRGFSGAPVFLLTGGCDDDHMKLIAIHAGYSEDLGTNFGFSVAKKVDEYEKFPCVLL